MNKDNQPTALPEGLRKQIEEFKKKLWKIKVTEAILAGLFGLIFSFLIILGIERLFEMPMWLRIANLFLGVSIFTVFAPLWINKWVFKHRKEQQIARLISTKFPHLGDRILGVIELEGQDQVKANVSPELREAAMVTVTREAGRQNFSDALPQSWLSKWFFSLTAAISLLILGVLLLPKDGITSSVKRWLAPWSETERFTFTQIDAEKFKDGLIVPLNEAFSLPVSLKETSREEADGQARYGKESWKKKDFEGDTVTFPFSGKTHKDVVTVQIGDAIAEIDVIPTPRPILRNTIGQITWPTYLQRDYNTEIQLSGGSIQVLEGSQLTLTSQADRELSSASHGLISRLAREGEDVEGEDETYLPTDLLLPITISEKRLITGPLTVGSDTLRFPLEWTDSHKLHSKRPAVFTIEPSSDTPPSSYIEAEETEFIQLLSSPIQFSINADDDFGIKTMGFQWQGTYFESTNLTPAQGKRIEYNPSHDDDKHLQFDSQIIFDPEKNGITTPQTVVFQAWVKDQLPGREPTLSQSKITVHFYSQEMMIAYNNSLLEELKNRTEALIESTDESIATSEQLNHLLNKAIENSKSPNSTTREEAKQKIAELKDQLGELADQAGSSKEDIDAIQQDAKDIFEEAAQDGTLEKNSLKELMEMQQNLKEASKAQQQAQDDFEKAENDLNDSSKEPSQDSNPSPSESSAKKKATEGQEQQEKAREALQQAANNAKDAKEKGEQATFVNRLKKAARDQMRVNRLIREEADKVADKDVDLMIFDEAFDNTTPSQQESLHSSYLLQKQIKVDLGWIIEDLSEYQARTQKEGLLEVVEAMSAIFPQEDSKHDNYTADAFVDQLIQRLEASHWYLSMAHADELSKIIDSWAKILGQQKNQGGGGGGGGGGAENSLNDDDFDFLMRVLRMVKKQQDIREKTRALEQQKRTLNLQNPTQS